MGVNRRTGTLQNNLRSAKSHLLGRHISDALDLLAALVRCCLDLLRRGVRCGLRIVAHIRGDVIRHARHPLYSRLCLLWYPADKL
jgi:hypothetical protein